VRFNGDQANPIYTAYFGYNNTGPVQFNFAVGDGNQVAPGIVDAGQPTAFNVGNYPRVFPVQFDGFFIKEISWELNGATATASTSSPACSSGVTAPASGVGSTTATLNGVVTAQGEDRTYSFEYGTSPSLGQSTPVQDGGAGTQPQLVQMALTGLMPSTQYFFRLDTTSGLAGTTHSQEQRFTTAATPAPVTPDRAATTTHLAASAHAVVSGRSVTYTATVSPITSGNGTPTGNVAFSDDAAPARCTAGS
jgi:hypothetical protein